jgi:thymidylate synthase (FAD)
MKIIEPSFEIVDPVSKEDGLKLLQKIERMARISHRSEDRQTDDSWEKFLKAVVIDRGDWSVVEHASATVIFRVDRGITHELVRHRLFSFTQESTRFVNGRKSYPNGLEFILSIDMRGDPTSEAEAKNCFRHGEMDYLRLLDRGIRPQEARSVLPNALASTISVSGNLRNFRHLFLMRTSRETHPDFRRVMIPLLDEFKKRVPILYDDIEPNARQIENMRKAR